MLSFALLGATCMVCRSPFFVVAWPLLNFILCQSEPFIFHFLMIRVENVDLIYVGRPSPHRNVLYLDYMLIEQSL